MQIYWLADVFMHMFLITFAHRRKKFENCRTHIIIHVHDDSNKSNLAHTHTCTCIKHIESTPFFLCSVQQDFICPRDVLIREMQYFRDHLTPSKEEDEPWEEVDISVHCDVSVFNWLMQYAKRGMLEGATGEELLEPLPRPRLGQFKDHTSKG